MNCINLKASLAVALTAACCALAIPAAALERGGEITASIAAEPKSLDPLFGDAPSVDNQVLDQIYDTLVRWTPDGQIEPYLAESYEFSDDALSLTFKLREGVTFHDGTALDAAAVVFNMERLLADDVPSLYTSGVADVESVEAIDPLTVRVNLSQPSAAVLAAYAGPAGMVASPAAIEEFGEDFGTNPVGTGPFKLDSRQAGTGLTLVRNDDFWKDGEDGQPLPYLDTVNFRWITQQAVKMIELESGNVDIVDDVASDDFGRIEQDEGLDLIDAGGIEQWIAFNITKPPFDDIRVRKAVYFGIDRPMAAQIIAGDYGRVIPTVVGPKEFAFDDTIDIYSHDPERSQELLAEAGYGPDNPLRFDLSMIQREPDVSIAQILQAQLQDIGIEVNIKQMERQAFIDEWRGKNHAAGLARVDLPRGDPDQTFYPFFGRDATQRTGAGDEELAELVDKGRVTIDQEERRQVYIDAQKRLLEFAHYVWIFMREAKHARTASLNMETSSVKTWYLDEAWLDR